MGRANRLLAPRVTAIATGFPRRSRIAIRRWHAKSTLTGNPVRPPVIAAATTPYAAPAPAARSTCWCSAAARARASWPTSCRRRSSSSTPKLRARLADRAAGARRGSRRRARRPMRGSRSPPRSRRSSPICRRAWRRRIWSSRAPAPRPSPNSRRSAGPRILVPLPHALDQDQLANAGVLRSAGGAIRLEQGDFTPERLAAEITALADRPGSGLPDGAAAQNRRHARCRRPAGRSGAEGGRDLACVMAGLVPAHPRPA